MKYKALRNVMHAKEVTQKELAKVIGVAPSTMSFKMNVKEGSEFTVAEMYKILDYLDLPDNALHVMFPRDGERSREAVRSMTSIKMVK